MKRFIEVTYNKQTVLLNVSDIRMVEPRKTVSPTDEMERGPDGTAITVSFGGPNDRDTVLNVKEDYETVKARINAAVN